MRYGRHLRHRRHSRYERHGSAIAGSQVVTGISVTPSALTASPDDTVTLVAAVAPTTASNKSVTWSILSGTGATLAPSGLTCNVVISPEATAGTIVVQAKTKEGEFTGTSTITIKVDEAGV